MYNNYNIVCVTPAGRQKYLEILLRYVISNKWIIDRWELWLNTSIQIDIDYINSLEKQYPGFISVVRIQDDTAYAPNQLYNGYTVHTIHLFFNHCTDENSIYLRLDDDIVFVEKRAIENLIKFRIDNQEPFLIYGNIVNNAVCNFIHQRSGVLAHEHGICGVKCMDEVGWANPVFALYVHSKFIELYNENKLNLYTSINNFNSYERFSINVICWFGKEFANFGGEVGVDEEQWLTEDYPRHIGKYSTICGSALFSHYSFHIQRKSLESIPQILEAYNKMSLKENEGTVRK